MESLPAKAAPKSRGEHASRACVFTCPSFFTDRGLLAYCYSISKHISLFTRDRDVNGEKENYGRILVGDALRSLITCSAQYQI
jgi:hypothetical protein